MNTVQMHEEYDPIYQRAMEIIDNEWVEAGMTREELEQNRQIGEIIADLRTSGRSLESIEAEWQGKSKEQILRDYTLVPLH